MNVEAMNRTTVVCDVAAGNDTQHQHCHQEEVVLPPPEAVHPSMTQPSSPSNHNNLDDVAEAALAEAVEYIQNRTGDDGHPRDGSNKMADPSPTSCLVQNPMNSRVSGALLPAIDEQNSMVVEGQVVPIPMNQSTAASVSSSIAMPVQNPIHIQEMSRQSITSSVPVATTNTTTEKEAHQPQTELTTTQLQMQIQAIPTTWEAQFQKLLAYKLKHGNCKVPKKYLPDPQLGRWVNTQRYKNNTNTLSTAKKSRLDSIQFEWNVRKPNQSWKHWIKKLSEYKAHHGNCDVPQRYSRDRALGAFVSNLRGEYRKYTRGKNSSLNPKTIKMLEDMGFRWSVASGKVEMIAWEERVRQLKEYKEKFGNCNVPKEWSDNVGLGDWVETLRHQFQSHSLSTEQIRELQDLGFDWTFQDMIDELKKYKKEHGDCNVPLDYGPNPCLGIWVDSQRKKYKSLAKERIVALIELGFDFRVNQTETTDFLETNTNTVNLTVPVLQEKGALIEQEDEHNIPRKAPSSSRADTSISSVPTLTMPNAVVHI